MATNTVQIDAWWWPFTIWTVVALLVVATIVVESTRGRAGLRVSRVDKLNDPIRLGVHPAAAVKGSRVPAFVPRDRLPDLENALRAGGFILVVGDSTAGKTRLAYEAMRATLPHHDCIQPLTPDALPAALALARRKRRSVLWLDDLERYLGFRGLSVATLPGCVVLATMRTPERDDLSFRHDPIRSPGERQSARAGREVLNAVTTEIRLDRMWSSQELMLARASGDERIMQALGSADVHGIAETMAAGPQLLEEWRDGRNVRGAAISDAPEVTNKITGASLGNVVQAGTVLGGVHVGDVNLVTGVAVRTRYQEQVRRIAPSCLVGRECELAALATFCTSPQEAGSYWWWRGEAWSGKSALMSWFVLHPPAGVRVVSFFITARWHGQNDRRAFIDNVLEQLVTVLGEDMPPFTTESTQEAHLLGLLADAAEACRGRGEQFVLLVDGLDEDRGVTISPDAHSIAALLPSEPPAGMQIIVAGRPNPPIPTDVPQHHPLRDARIVHWLGPSPKAQAVRAEMERELKRLLHGTEAEQDLLGLLTAAGGGLTAHDLAELTGCSSWEVSDHLRVVTGRSFTRRSSHYRPGTGADVYLLGHEELQVTAEAVLGPKRLAGYLQRLHAWAEHYRSQQWPGGTPEYLLRGYYNMLTAAGDLPRMIAYATDPARQERLLDMSGGDAAALAEIAAAERIILTHEHPDLAAMGRLAIHRDYLIERNHNIPTDLPAVWAILGHPKRAEALAHSISWPEDRVRALMAIADAVTRAGDLDRATEVVNQVEELARTIAIRDGRGGALADLVVRVAETGDLDRADVLARGIPDARTRSGALAGLAVNVAKTGDLDRAAELVNQAEELARTISDPDRHSEALTTVMKTVAEMGDLVRAAELVNQAEELAQVIAVPERRSSVLAGLVVRVAETGDLDRADALVRTIPDAREKSEALAGLSVKVAEAGDLARAAELVNQAEELAHTITDLLQQSRTLTALAVEMSKAGDLDRADALVRTIPDACEKSEALAGLSVKVAEMGDLVRAAELVNQAEELAYASSTAYQRNVALVSVVEALSEIGDLDRGDALARAITDAREQSQVLATLAAKVAKTGDLDRAVELAHQAQVLARAITRPEQLSYELGVLMKVAAELGDVNQAAELANQAEKLARASTITVFQSQALANLAVAVAETGDLDRAEEVAHTIADPYHRSIALASLVAAGRGDLDRTEELARSIPTPWQQSQALRTLVEAATAAGRIDRAESLARTITEPHAQTRALSGLAVKVAETGDLGRAAALVNEAEELARTITDPFEQDWAVALAVNVADTGDLDRAHALACTIIEPDRRSYVLAALAVKVAKTGDLSRAAVLVNQVEELAQIVTDPYQRSWAMARVVEAVAAMGDFDRAEELASPLTPAFRKCEALMFLAMNPKYRHRRSLAAQIFKLGSWDMPLGLLVQIQPDALPVMVDEFAFVINWGSRKVAET